MKSSKLMLFENLSANFRLSVDTMYEKVSPDGSTKNSVYINQEKETGTFKPSVFLVFTYLTDDFNTTKGIYTSVPHIYRIRQAFDYVHQMLHAPDAFIDVNGVKDVSPAYAQSVVIDNLSQKTNDWITLTLTTCKDSTSVNNRPAVAIQHSKSNGYSSILTEDEFNTIYDLIMHLDYVSLESQAVIIELASRNLGKSGSTKTAYNQSAPQGRVVSASPRMTTPVTSGGYRPTGTPAYQQRVVQAQPASVAATPVAPAPISADVKLPPRPVKTTPKVSMTNIEEIEVDDISIEDDALVQDIFNTSLDE